ncbi:lactosylceramide 1,3-N-acetyl-beta-D-glucosaminyltransferase [Aplysia californica]|uniref:Hexosyltransferase n=1 Tax=Aplysia californica TaxID=6500 RepID=A0ABM0JXT5_APLCA|nr:lactosylceramide 1,3-N-acetyl-beta-D-glucosaminyltransferase [Aplysia californica]
MNRMSGGSCVRVCQRNISGYGRFKCLRLVFIVFAAGGFIFFLSNLLSLHTARERVGVFRRLYESVSFQNRFDDFPCNDTSLSSPAELSNVTNISPDLAQFLSLPVINPHPYEYVHNHEGRCQAQRPKVLFVVPSAPDNFVRRQKVRHSPLMEFLRKSSCNATLLFFLGLPAFSKRTSEKIQRRIDSESEQYKDIIQAGFNDAYQNIRLKAVSMLKWASIYCSNASYVIRTDDDIKFDVGEVVGAVYRAGKAHRNFVLGNLALDWKVIRNKQSKYYVSREEFASDDLPPFALGGLLGYPLESVRLLYEASLRTKPLWLDDVYITGICAPRVNVTLLGDPQFTFRH